MRDRGDCELIHGIAQELGICTSPSDMLWFELGHCHSPGRSWRSYLPSSVRERWLMLLGQRAAQRLNRTMMKKSPWHTVNLE